MGGRLSPVAIAAGVASWVRASLGESPTRPSSPGDDPRGYR
jgi:hypothetical protein